MKTYRQLRSMNLAPSGKHYSDMGTCPECRTDKANAELTGGCFGDCTLQTYVDLGNLPAIGSDQDRFLLGLTDAEYAARN